MTWNLVLRFAVVVALTIGGVTSASTDDALRSSDSCQVEAVFQTPDGIFWSIERSKDHPGATSSERVEAAHVANWTNWNNGFPVVDKAHYQLPEVLDVFPNSAHYVVGASMNDEGQLVLAVDYSRFPDQWPKFKSDHRLSQIAVHIYSYNEGSKTFSHVAQYNASEYYPHIKQIEQEEGLKFMRIQSIAFVTGPLPENKQYIVTDWFVSSDSSSQNEIRETRLRMDRSRIVTHTVLKEVNGGEFIPNMMHVMESGEEHDRVLQGAYSLWRYSNYTKNVDHALKPWKDGPWHLQNSLLGCPQVLCFDADVDAIASTPDDGTIIFLGCYFWRTGKMQANPQNQRRLPTPNLGQASLIKDVFGETIGCNVWAAFVQSDTLFLFQGENFYKCSYSSKSCGDPIVIDNVFPGVTSVTAATVDSSDRVWLIDGGQYVKYSIFKMKNDGPADQVKAPSYLQRDYPFLPATIDDMDLTSDNNIRFFTENFHIDVPEGSRKEVDPVLSPGVLFQCNYDMYVIAKYLDVYSYADYAKWRKPPPPAPPVPDMGASYKKKTEFNWLWLLLLLLLLIPICCFIPCRKPHRRSNPQSQPESLFARSALGSALSAIRPDNDLRSSISDYPSNKPVSTVLRTRVGNLPTSSTGSRSGMSDASGPGAGSTRRGLSSPVPGTLSSASRRSGLSNGSSGSPSSPGSVRSGLSNASGSPKSGGKSRSGISDGGSRALG